MQTVNIPTMKQLVDHIAVRKRRPVMIHGPSGVGKSEGVQQSCQEHDGVLVDIRVSQYESIDFRGIPDIQSGSTVWNMPATLPFKGNPKFVEDRQPIFLFLDEANQGDPSVMSVCYQLTQDYRIGEHQLMDNVRIILAGNRAKDRGVTNRFPDPLSNRITHCEVVPDVKAWSKWASNPDTKTPAALIGFLNFRDGLLHTHDPAKPTPTFATPRSWSYVADDMLDTEMPENVRIASMCGSVGEGPATELLGFMKIMDGLVPLADIIANPKKVPVPTELDMQWAMATHVAAGMTVDNATPLHTYLDRMEPEMVVMAWTLAIQRDADITDSNAFLMDYAPTYRGLFQN